MDLENKLDGFPHVYYFNMDDEVERREYMENQFQYYGIDYTRVSSNRFDAKKIHEWKDYVFDVSTIINDMQGTVPRVLANFVSHIVFLKEWYQSSNEEYIVLMEDDYDLSLIDYWHFNWKYLMSKLPFDWDSLQLGYEHYEKIYFSLDHKDYRSFNFGPTLINKKYVGKIIDLLMTNNQVLLRPQFYYSHPSPQFSVDNTINHLGKNYTIPLITTNTNFFQKDNLFDVYKRHQTNRYIYHYWWKNKRDNFTVDDFFTIYKSDVREDDMTEYLYNYESRALSF